MSVPSRICHPVAKLVEKESRPGFNCHCAIREKDRDIGAMPRQGAGEGEKGDTTPHLFRATPEDTINVIFLAMT